MDLPEENLLIPPSTSTTCWLASQLQHNSALLLFLLPSPLIFFLLRRFYTLQKYQFYLNYQMQMILANLLQFVKMKKMRSTRSRSSWPSRARQLRARQE